MLAVNFHALVPDSGLSRRVFAHEARMAVGAGIAAVALPVVARRLPLPPGASR